MKSVISLKGIALVPVYQVFFDSFGLSNEDAGEGVTDEVRDAKEDVEVEEGEKRSIKSKTKFQPLLS